MLHICRFLPTYYLADGVVKASQNLSAWSSHFIDFSVLPSSTVALLAISTWLLCRQSSVLAML